MQKSILILLGLVINAHTFDVNECWKDYYPRSVNSPLDQGNRYCGDGLYVAGVCYAPCGEGETRQPTGWCKKPNGVLYLPQISQPKCDPSLEQQAGLCYPKCRDGYKGIGVLCWSNCESTTKFKADCGMYCGPNYPYCDARNLNIVLTLGTSVAAVVTNPTVANGFDQVNSITSQMSGRQICDTSS